MIGAHLGSVTPLDLMWRLQFGGAQGCVKQARLAGVIAIEPPFLQNAQCQTELIHIEFVDF